MLLCSYENNMFPFLLMKESCIWILKILNRVLNTGWEATKNDYIVACKPCFLWLKSPSVEKEPTLIMNISTQKMLKFQIEQRLFEHFLNYSRCSLPSFVTIHEAKPKYSSSCSIIGCRKNNFIESILNIESGFATPKLVCHKILKPCLENYPLNSPWLQNGNCPINEEQSYQDQPKSIYFFNISKLELPSISNSSWLQNCNSPTSEEFTLQRSTQKHILFNIWKGNVTLAHNMLSFSHDWHNRW